MLSSFLKDSRLFICCKRQMFWLAIVLFGLSEGSVYVGVTGGDAYLNWTITNPYLSEVGYIKNLDANTTLIVFYPDSTMPSITYDKRVNYTGNLTLLIVSFTLSNITCSDAGRYAFFQKNQDIGGQVLVIAENPIITGIPVSLESAVAGRDHKLNCSAESKSIPPGYNLTMLSEWKRNAANITPGFKYSVSGTILTIINVTRAEFGDRYTCIAYEDQRKKSNESGEFNLNVLYGPDNMHITPSDEVNVDEGESLNITCVAECNPLCTSYQWQKDTQSPLVASSVSYVVQEVNRTHAGVYTCTVNNTVILRSATAKTTVKVNYGPDAGRVFLLPNNNSYELAESSHLTVNCSTDCIPECQYRWTGPGGSSQGNTRSLSIPQIYRNQTGLFTCTAFNPKITSNLATANISIIVLYGPDTNSITLSPNNNSYEVLESSHLSINCSTKCVPTCQYRWNGPGGSYHGNTGSLSIPQIYRNQTGSFTCTASNPKITSNSTTATISVVVLYRASVTNFTAKDNINMIKENDSLQLHCKVDSNPLSYIFLYSQDNIQLKKEENTLKLNYTIKTADCLDAGNYTCRANNSIMNGDYASSDLQIIVACSPRLDHRKDMSTVYYAGLNSNVTLEVYVIAYPDPTNINWYHRENKTDIWQRITYQPPVYGGLFSILIQLTSQRDFGYYMVTMENYLGNFSNTYNIIPESKPEVPLNFSVTESGPYSLTLEWAPGFGGGHPQHFIIEYAKHSDRDWLKSGEILDDRSPMQSSILSGLQQKTTYQFRMYAENKIGGSEKTQIITATTSDNAKADVLPIGAIVGGISGAVVAVVLVILVLIFLRHGGLKSKQKGDAFTKDVQANKKTTKDPLYANSGTSYVTTGGIYEALQDNRNEGSLYHELTDIKSCSDTNNSFRKSTTDTTERHPTYVNTNETTNSPEDQGNFFRGENKTYENTRVQA